MPAPYAAWSDVEKLLAAIPAASMTSWVTALAAAGSTPDQFYEDFIGPSTDAAINAFCRRTFHSTTEERQYKGNDSASLYLDVWPIRSVTSVTMYSLVGQVYFAFDSTNMQYVRKYDPRGIEICEATDGASPMMQVVAAEGILNILPSAVGLQVWQTDPVYPYFTFPSMGGWWENIHVALTYGYVEENLPQDIRGAAARLAAADVALQIGILATSGMISWTVGPETRRWGGGGGGGMDPFGGFLGDGPYSPFRTAMVSFASTMLKKWIRMTAH